MPQKQLLVKSHQSPKLKNVASLEWLKNVLMLWNDKTQFASLKSRLASYNGLQVGHNFYSKVSTSFKVNCLQHYASIESFLFGYIYSRHSWKYNCIICILTQKFSKYNIFNILPFGNHLWYININPNNDGFIHWF